MKNKTGIISGFVFGLITAFLPMIRLISIHPEDPIHKMPAEVAIPKLKLGVNKWLDLIKLSKI